MWENKKTEPRGPEKTLKIVGFEVKDEFMKEVTGNNEGSEGKV